MRLPANKYRLRIHRMWLIHAQAAMIPSVWSLTGSQEIPGWFIESNWFRSSQVPTWLYVEWDEELPIWVNPSRQTHENKQHARTIIHNILIAWCNWQNTFISMILIIVLVPINSNLSRRLLLPSPFYKWVKNKSEILGKLTMVTQLCKFQQLIQHLYYP